MLTRSTSPAFRPAGSATDSRVPSALLGSHRVNSAAAHTGKRAAQGAALSVVQQVAPPRTAAPHAPGLGLARRLEVNHKGHREMKGVCNSRQHGALAGQAGLYRCGARTCAIHGDAADPHIPRIERQLSDAVLLDLHRVLPQRQGYRGAQV